MTEQTCPPLPAGSFDMNLLHEAFEQGADPAEAVALASNEPEPLTVEEVEALPSLSGKTRAQLDAIAEAEGVELLDGMTNAERVAAIDEHRATLAAAAIAAGTEA